MGTIYHCRQGGRVVHNAKTEREALYWLSENNGGEYRNILHNIRFEVKPGEYNRMGGKPRGGDE